MKKPKRRVDVEKDRLIKARVSGQELQAIDKRASDLKLSRSKYIRQAALHHKVVVVGRDELKGVKSELRKLGINVNQIAVLCNMGKITCVQLNDVKNSLDKIWSEIRMLRENINNLIEREDF